MKPNEWLGYSADTSDDEARRHAARRLGCSVDEVEDKRNDGAVLVRRRRDENLFTTTAL